MPGINETNASSNVTPFSNAAFAAPNAKQAPAKSCIFPGVKEYKVNNGGTCSVNLAGWVQADKKDGNLGATPNTDDNSNIVNFADTNKDGQIDKDDIVTYKDAKGREIATAVKDLHRGVLPAQLDILLGNGQRVTTTITNLRKADAVLGFEANEITNDGNSSKLCDAINNAKTTTDGKLYKLTNNYITRVANMMSSTTDAGLSKLQSLTNKLKAQDESKLSKTLFTLEIPGSSQSATNPFGSTTSGAPNMSGTILNLTGVRTFVEKPILEELQKPITRADMKENNNWNSTNNLNY